MFGQVLFYYLLMSKITWCGVNNVDPDQTPHAASDLGLHCLLRPVCPKTWDKCGIHILFLCICFSFEIDSHGENQQCANVRALKTDQHVHPPSLSGSVHSANPTIRQVNSECLDPSAWECKMVSTGFCFRWLYYWRERVGHIISMLYFEI